MRNIILIIIISSILSSCATVPEQIINYDLDNNYSFLEGFWHGFIILFSFVASLFNDNILIYQIDNNGIFYDFGFLVGIGALTRFFKSDEN